MNLSKKLAIASYIGSTVFCVEANESRPNIVFLMADDQSYLAVGYNGNREVQTPNIDALAANGTVFNNHYANTSICMASRAIIMTGMYEYKTGCNFQHGAMTKKKFALSYPNLLRKNGYYTGFAGKFGFAVTDAETRNFSHDSYDLLPVADFDWWAGGIGQTNYSTVKNKYIAKYADRYPHSSRAYAAASDDFFQKAKASGKPFCLSVSFKAPHAPYIPDPIFNGLYQGKTYKKPENFGIENSKHLAKQSIAGRQRVQYFAKDYSTDVKFNETEANYYQLIHGVDVAVGMIVQSLKKHGLADNTVIIYTSDNGYNQGAHGFGGKVLPYEEGSKVPMVIYDPRKSAKKSQVTRSLTGSIDIAPTILTLAGITPPSNMDGKTMTTILDDSSHKIHTSMMIMNMFGSASTQLLGIISDDWKYLYWGFAEGNLEPVEELFNTSKDKYEMKNLAMTPEYGAVLNSMRERYDQAIIQWKNDAVNYNGYAKYSKIFDRAIPWNEKKDLFTSRQIEEYKLFAIGKDPKQERKKEKKNKNNKKR